MRDVATSRVEACVVNHNTSEFAELALRTLVATHQQRLAAGQLRVSVVDNHSTDEGLSDLVAAARKLGATFQRSRWPAATAPVNSHGDVLRDFVAAHHQATHVLFVDADVVFTAPDPLGVMLAEMDGSRDVWAVQARFHWDEDKHGPGASLDIWAGHRDQFRVGIGRMPVQSFPGQHKRRCNPACTLVANTPVFRSVAEIIGLSAGVVVSADEQLAGFADTLGLASLAMRTHGLRYVLSAVTVGHYSGVSYHDPDNPIDVKVEECRRRLAALRAGATFDPGVFG
jgi:hypothetical protein